MNKLVSGKCPDCGANIDLPSELQTTFCAYCGNKISVEEAVEKLKIELSGKIEVDGINSLKKLYQNAESYLKLQEYENAYNVYISIIQDNPEEIKAYQLALSAISYNMTRVGKYPYPTNYLNDINICLDRLKKLDTNSEYLDFINDFTNYINYCNIEENILSKVSSFKTFNNGDPYSFKYLEEDYFQISELYNQFDDERKSIYAPLVQSCKDALDKAPRPSQMAKATVKAIDTVLDVIDNPFSIFGKFKKK